MIDITEVNAIEFVKKVYDLSRPQGMGMIHFTPEPLTDEEAQKFINKDGTVNMDYVSGRACKMHTFNRDGKIQMGDSWYDHSDAQLSELLQHFNISIADNESKDHNCSCNCDDCRVKRGDGPLDPEADFLKASKAHEDGTAFKFIKL